MNVSGLTNSDPGPKYRQRAAAKWGLFVGGPVGGWRLTGGGLEMIVPVRLISFAKWVSHHSINNLSSTIVSTKSKQCNH
jgi:hypothetical protein